MKNIILNNLGLKLLALFLAVLTWFYIVEELQKGAIEESEALKSIFPYRIVSKQLPIKLNLTGEPEAGYRMLKDKITLDPSSCVIIGPKSFLKKVSSIETQPISISGDVKTIIKDISIIPPIKGISIKEKFVTVTIPIEKSEE